MLGKLLKHEFRATGRVMGPLLLILLALSVLANLSIRLLEGGDSGFLNIVAVISLVLYGCGVVAAGVMALVVMIQRFYKNLLGDEGYLTFTLPVGVHSLVWSKLIVSVCWFVVTGLVVILSVFVMVASVELLGELREGFAEFGLLFEELGGGNMAGYILELVLLVVVSCLTSCLMFYLAMALGHSFANHKFLLSVVCFVGLSILLNIVTTYATLLTGYQLDGVVLMEDVLAFWHYALLAICAYQLVIGALCYAGTALTLKKRLNLA